MMIKDDAIREGMLYLHIPFCVKKCAYCDFLSGPGTMERIDSYVVALCHHLIKSRIKAEGSKISSVFFGGGTPSLLSADQMRQIMDTIRENYSLTEDAEISMEMNPGTVTREKLDGFYRAGINRVSIGLQSMDNDELKLLGRIHDADTFLSCYEMVRSAGFGNVNIDLMMGLPGQKGEILQKTLKQVIALKPEHISLYSLILEEGTPLYDQYKDSHKLLSQEEDRSLYHDACKMLEQALFHQYEISNFARDGYSCHHNEGYWRRRPYLGFGIGASSFWEEMRFQNTPDLNAYLEEDFAPRQVEILTKEDAMEEFMFLGLRTTSGISVSEFEQTFGTSFFDVYGEASEKLISQGLLKKQGERLFCTSAGMDLNNLVAGAFLL